MAVQQSPSLSSIATDPLRVFKFEVLFHPPQALAASLGVSASSSFSYGFMTVSGPAINIEVIPYREGGMNTTTQKMPGQADFGSITMSHGVKMASSQMDILWMSQLFTVMQGSGNQAPGAEFRMICDVYVLDHPVTTASAPVKAAFRLYNTWPSSLAFSDFDAGANAFLIAQMSLAYEGFDVLVAAGSGTTEVSFSS
jgi:phage tail-like protein